MEGKLKLVGYKFSSTVQRILAVAKFAGTEVTLENVNWGDSTRDSLKKNSETGTFPYLETPHGTLSEAFAIVQFLASQNTKTLLGATEWEQAQVNQWVQFAQWEIIRYNKSLVYPLLGFYEFNKAEAEQSLREIKEWLKNLNNHLSGRTYVVGENVTLADLELFYALRGYYQLVFPEEVRNNLLPNVTAWFVRLAGNQNLVSAYGRTLLCKVPQQAPNVEKTLKLVGYKYSGTVQRILAAAKFAGAPLVLENVNWGDASREELKSKTATKTFPYLQTQKGNLSEAYAIVKYLANTYNTSLWGSNEWETAQVNQWVEFAHWEISRHNKALLYPIFGFNEYHKEEADQATKELKEWLKVLNTNLKNKDFIVGNSYTVADLELFVALRGYLTLVFVEDVRKNLFPNVTAWFVKLAANPHIVSSYGRTLLCKVPQKAPKVEKKEVVAAPKKKEEKEEKKPEVEAGEDEEGKLAKKKANPLDLLPPSPFVLDDFKREFLNSKDKPAVLAEFWKKFDANGYSLWRMRYDKLPSEGKVLFRCKNSMSFFLQKLDSFRKYSFAAHGIYGTEGDYDIRGLWMWRGLDIPEEVKQHESYEYMQITKLDHNKEEDRKLLESYWLHIDDGEIVDGLPVAYAETYK